MRSTRSSAEHVPAAGARAFSRGLAVAGLLVALGAVLGLVESAIVPPLPVPGVRLGLANLVVVLAIVVLGPRASFGVSLGRVVLVGIASGSLLGPAGALSLAGATAAWCVMAGLSLRTGACSVIGLSVAGAAAHVTAQLGAASLLTGTAAPLSFAPLSLLLSLACGLAVGYSARLLLSRLPLTAAVEVGR